MTTKQRELLLTTSRKRLELSKDLYFKASRVPPLDVGTPRRRAADGALGRHSGRCVWSWRSTRIWIGGAWWVAELDADNYLKADAEGAGLARDSAQRELFWAYASKAELYLLASGGVLLKRDDDGPRPSLSEAELAARAIREHEASRRAGEVALIGE